MNINNLTIKAQEVLQNAMNVASSQGNQAVEPLHILDAVLSQEQGVGSFLLQKVGVNVRALQSMVQQEVSRFPKDSGGDA